MKKTVWVNVLALGLVLLVALGGAEAAALRSGDQGPYVSEVQQALFDAGYEIEVDGKFGPATERALKQFQADNGLEVDGLAGTDVYRLLLGKEVPADIPTRDATASIMVSRGGYGGDFQHRLAQTAIQYLGVPYVYGGSTPTGGFDCSGFVQYVYRQMGIDLPRTADVQYLVGTPVEKDQLRTGDLVFFAGDYVNVSHVGIYLSDGNFIHASTTYGIAYDSLYRDYRVDHYVGATRIIY